MNDSMSRDWEDLANAVILQAIEDYRSVLSRVRRRRRKNPCIRFVRNLDQFFRSRWFRMLTDLDGEALISSLKEEQEYDH